MNIAIVGCGFVADYYLATLPSYPELKLIGVTDRDPDRAARLAAFHSVPRFGSLDDLLSDGRVELVINLTNPRSHHDVTKTCLEAGKHVYSEKPFAMELEEAQELVAIAERRGLGLASAPCSLLGETAQTLWKALRERVVGTVRLVYAEMDDGMVFRMPYRRWVSRRGRTLAGQGRIRGRVHVRARGLLLDMVPGLLRAGAVGDSVFGVSGPRQANRRSAGT